MSLVDGETEVQELEVGIDPGELYANEEIQELEIVHKGKKWVFKYKDLSWKEKYDCVDAATVMDGENVGFFIGKYYVLALTRMLVDSPIKPLTETTIGKLDKNVGAQLLSIVPPPADPALVEGLKKG